MTANALREPWADITRQRESAVLAMWLFLATEVLFFGGLFAGYAIYRMIHATEFLEGARKTEIVYGAANTAILLTSSFTMAVGARCAREGFATLARLCFVATMLFGILFLVLKGFEYGDDISKHLVPGPGFAIPLHGAEIFWTFYWVMTLVHALHLLIGIGAVLRLHLASRRDAGWLKTSPAAEVTALYWHFVDAIWVVLFPLLYLAGRA
jgi:cytochrome c oxidase subunit 3